MEITTDLRKRDLAWVSVHMLFRARFNWIFVLLLSLVILAVLVIAREPRTYSAFLLFVGASLVGGVAGLIAGMAFQLLFTLMSVGKDGGVLGIHTLTLTDRGLHERTEANEGLQLWRGIRSIKSVGDYILIQINAYQFHIVPRRAFQTREDFDAFLRRAKDLWKAA
jgi:hypothetical protein